MKTTKELFSQAQNQLRDGKSAEATETLNRALAMSPDDPNSLRLLGLIELEKGNLDKSVELLRRAAEAAPNFFQARLDYGRALFAANRYEAACEAINQLLIDRESSEAWQLLGNVFAAMKDRNRSINAFKQAVKTDPFRGDIARGIQALTNKKGSEAESIFRAVLQKQHDHVHALIGLATVALDTGNAKDAKTLLNHGIRISPNTESLWRGLARAHSESAEVEKARGAAQKAVELAPDVADCWTMLGTVLAGALDPGGARDCFKKSLELKSNQPRVLLSLGHVEKTIGNSAGSESAYDEAFVLDPLLGEAMWSKADLKTYLFSDKEIEQMEGAVHNKKAAATDIAAFHFALGKAYEDRKNFARSFEHYYSGNEIKAKIEDFSLSKFRERNSKIQAAFRTVNQKAVPEETVFRPIFILGMPRAGSTLIEQILASHSEIEGTMELPQILNFARELESQPGGYERLKDSAGKQLANDYGERYLEETRPFRTGKRLFIDKMPNNFMHIGFIATILPNAVFIDARRNALDCCFSAFKQNFARGQTFSYGLERVGHYFKEYRLTMDYWNKVLPNRILEVHYESVVADLEREVRRLLNHCSVPFEESCIQFHQTDRAVRTASAQQVRQPIYKKGIAHWQNYEEWLTPLKKSIGPTLLD
jgi:tetratricopeptide (TPR) repeat protein